MKYSHTIEFYKQICGETDYTLWRVLHESIHHKGALAGLDDVTAAGINGFKILDNVAEKMKRKDKSLEKGKRYLKSNYPVNSSERNISEKKG